MDIQFWHPVVTDFKQNDTGFITQKLYFTVFVPHLFLHPAHLQQRHSKCSPTKDVNRHCSLPDNSNRRQ